MVLEFTATIGTADGSTREQEVPTPDGLITTALEAVKADLKDGETLLAIKDGNGGGIHLVSETFGRWAGTVIPESTGEFTGQDGQVCEFVIFHEHGHEPGYVPEDYVTVMLSNHFTEMQSIRLTTDEALRLAFLLHRAAGWAEDAVADNATPETTISMKLKV